MGSSKAKVVYHGEWQTYDDSAELFILELSDDRFFYIELASNPYTPRGFTNSGFLSLEESIDRIEEFEQVIKEITYGDLL